MKVPLVPGGLQPEPTGVPLAGLGADLALGRVASCLARGWRTARPRGSLTLLPVADGGPDSAQVIAPDQVVSREVIQGQGLLGQIREIGLTCLVPRSSRSGGRHPAEASTWFLGTAHLLALLSGPDEATQETLEDSASGLGEVIGAVLSRTDPLDALVVGMSRSAVHDGDLGVIDTLDGLRAAKDLLSYHSLGLALADDVSPGGMNGAGAALTNITSINPEQAQELDRRACVKAMESTRAAEDLDPGGLNTRRSLPVVSALNDAGPSTSTHATDSTGTARLSVSTQGAGADGDSALLPRVLEAWTRPETRIMAELVCLSEAAYGQDPVVSARGEFYDIPADGVVGVVGQQAASQAQPCILMCRRCVVSCGELATTGVTNACGLQEACAAEP